MAAKKTAKAKKATARAPKLDLNQEFVTLEFGKGMGAKITNLYNAGYRKWRHFSNDVHTYIVFKKQ